MDASLVVRIVGTLFCIAGIILCWRLGRTKFSELPLTKQLVLGVVLVSSLALWKILALLGLFGIPLATVAIANFHLMESAHQVDGCASCHVMLPMVNDMRNPNSDTIAARHFKNRWISTNQCYQCHADYGFTGDFEAKMTGFRHLARYTTKTFEEPIIGRTPFKNQNCLKCHLASPRFASVASHKAVMKHLTASSMSCLNCHGKAHPTREQRTPGSIEYARFMERVK